MVKLTFVVRDTDMQMHADETDNADFKSKILTRIRIIRIISIQIRISVSYIFSYEQTTYHCRIPHQSENYFAFFGRGLHG